MSTLRVAAVQCTAGTDRAANLDAATPLVAEAQQEADLVVLPELFSLLGPRAVMREGAEPLDGPTVKWAGERAREGGSWILAGSITERGGPSGDADGRNYNTAVLVDPRGSVTATYRKIHLFDNDVAGAAYQESATVAPGAEIVVADLDRPAGGARVGLATCYDLRFPELFRILALRGAQVILVPSAFTAVTGAAHWEVLLRARAIENQCFVVAAGQWGRTGAGIECYGHSLIVDPWGEVLASRPTGDGVVAADLDLDRVAEVRARLPSLANRQPTAYGSELS